MKIILIINKIRGIIKEKVISLFIFIFLNTKIYYFDMSFLKHPKISIFLPIYNKEIYLNNCLQSLRNQTLKDIEIVAVNDGSTDNSLKILKKLQKKDKRIKIINNDRNHGLLYSRAMGILNSSGKYLMNLDPDDKLVNNDDLDILYRASKLKEYDLTIFLIKRVALNESDIGYFKYLDENQLTIKDDHITNKLVEKNLFLKAFNDFKDEIFGNHWDHHEDNVWCYLVRKYANSIGTIHRYVYEYTRNSDSLNNQRGDKIDLLNKFYKFRKFQKMKIKEINENILNPSLYQIKQYNFILKIKEIKHEIKHLLVKLLKSYTNQTFIYKKINLVLNKISENKIIIFHKSEIKRLINWKTLQNVLHSSILTHKNVITINFNNNSSFDEIRKYIYLNDILIILDNLIFTKEIETLLESHKNNLIFSFINGTKYRNDINYINKYKIIKVFTYY